MKKIILFFAIVLVFSSGCVTQDDTQEIFEQVGETENQEDIEERG